MVGVVVGVVDNKVVVCCEGMDDTEATCGSWLDDALPFQLKLLHLPRLLKKY